MTTAPPLTSAQIQTALLRVLSEPVQHSARTLGNPQGLAELVSREFPETEPLTATRPVMEAVWSLVGQGLVYINYYDSYVNHWSFQLTAAGQAAANDQTINPDSPDQYLQRLKEAVPAVGDTILQYTNEALACYLNRCYLASAVMLGVASEAAFLEMAEAFGRWLPQGDGEAFLEFMGRPRTSFLQKFQEYRKKLEPRKPELPDELADGMTLTLDAILDLLRIYRNEAGHPRGKQIEREQAKINLELFARYLERMYAFKAFFERFPSR